MQYIEQDTLKLPTSLIEDLAKEQLFISLVTGTKVQALLQNQGINTLLSKEEWGQAIQYKTMKRKLSWLAGQIAGKISYCKINQDAKPEEVPIFRNDYGKPYFPLNKSLNISISHCNDYAVAVVSPFEVGIDLEEIMLRPDSFIKTWLSLKEQETLAALSNKEFFTNKCWTMKEAYSKLLGVGGRISFKNFCSITKPREIGYSTNSYEFDSYVLSLVWNNKRTA